MPGTQSQALLCKRIAHASEIRYNTFIIEGRLQDRAETQVPKTKNMPGDGAERGTIINLMLGCAVPGADP
jgi:hypothetical protein